MLVRRIRAKKFGPYDDLDVELPEKGLVLITAPNGSGKSTLLEAVAFAAYGEFLRGSSMQRGEELGLAEVETEHGTISRRFGKQKLLSTSFLSVEGLTTTKTQELLDEKIGSFDLWRRSSVFSADDVDRFSSMTDADRKRFLEGVTDPDGRLEAASARAREDLRRAEGELAVATRELAVLAERRTAADARARELSAAAKKTVDGPGSDAFVARLAELGVRVRDAAALAESKRRASSAERQGRIAKLGEARTIRSTAAAEARALRAREHLLRDGRCGECGQEIGKRVEKEIAEASAKADALEKAAEKSAAALEALAEKHGVFAEEFDAEAAAAEKAEHDLVRAQAEVQAEIARLAAVEREAAAAKESFRKALRALEDVEDAIGAAEGAAEKLRREVVVLGMVAQVLGPRGVRGRFLEHVLRSVEAEANVWLDRLRGEHPEMNLKLQPYAEKAKGGVSDVIALKVDYGGGSYASSSRGERRRVDVALTLATSALTAGGGKAGGTLWLDELMDGLDEGGVAAAADVVRDLARAQPVVLISHNRSLIGRLGEGVVHYEVDRGRLRRAEGG